MDRFASMEVFAKVAETGSFTAAAGALGISGQMVGKHVRQLEEHLGVRLLEPHDAPLEPNRRGQGFSGADPDRAGGA